MFQVLYLANRSVVNIKSTVQSLLSTLPRPYVASLDRPSIHYPPISLAFVSTEYFFCSIHMIQLWHLLTTSLHQRKNNFLMNALNGVGVVRGIENSFSDLRTDKQNCVFLFEHWHWSINLRTSTLKLALSSLLMGPIWYLTSSNLSTVAWWLNGNRSLQAFLGSLMSIEP